MDRFAGCSSLATTALLHCTAHHFLLFAHLRFDHLADGAVCARNEAVKVACTAHPTRAQRQMQKRQRMRIRSSNAQTRRGLLGPERMSPLKRATHAERIAAETISMQIYAKSRRKRKTNQSSVSLFLVSLICLSVNANWPWHCCSQQRRRRRHSLLPPMPHTGGRQIQ